ncbi:GFA family protein [Roseobacter sp. HKCCA0434]|uniref:GFA family protein n=1 Tax=Roseobacter sp. HKCCA0434 TaxID=3079297 RepID=UPI002905B2C6|nr:GFA family protein [Roseobacter sp. HKCCA0434]
MSERHSGSCLCGAVKYMVEGEMRPVIACHCVQCRKTSGHYGAATAARREDITVAGDVKWYVSSDSGKRGFCADCGSSVFFDGGGENLSIWAGTLDGETGLSIAGHIFTDDKGDYYDIEPGVRQAPQADPEMTTKVAVNKDAGG